MSVDRQEPPRSRRGSAVRLRPARRLRRPVPEVPGNHRRPQFGRVSWLGVSLIDAARGARLTERERINGAQAAWDGAGVEVTCLGLPDGALHPDRELISLVESDRIARKCTTLITHSPHAANDHQDHLALGAATTNAAARVPTCHTVLYGEPRAPYSGFSPTVLVDITDFLDDKIKALARQTSQFGRWYLREGYTRHRAADAAWRLHRAYAAQGAAFEAFESPLLTLFPPA